MTAWLVYIDTPRGPSPRVILDGSRGPQLGETERRHGVLATFMLGAGEERLPIAELVRRYPWPPAPKESPAPIEPDPDPTGPAGGAAALLEVV